MVASLADSDDGSGGRRLGTLRSKACCSAMPRRASCSTTPSRPLSAWFLMVLGVIALPSPLYSVGYFSHAVRRPARRASASRSTCCLAPSKSSSSRASVIAFLSAWEVMTLATAALVATEHEERASRRAAYLYLVMSHVGTGAWWPGSWSWLATPVRCRFRRLLSGSRGGGTAAGWLVRALLRGLRREGRDHPAARVAARSASRGAQQRLGADVGGVDHGGHLRALSRVRVRPRRPGPGLGPGVHVRRACSRRSWGSSTRSPRTISSDCSPTARSRTPASSSSDSARG